MQDVFNKVKIGTYPLPNNLSWEVVFFIEGMLQKDYDERLGWKELLYIYKWTKTRIYNYLLIFKGYILSIIIRRLIWKK